MSALLAIAKVTTTISVTSTASRGIKYGRVSLFLIFIWRHNMNLWERGRTPYACPSGIMSTVRDAKITIITAIICIYQYVYIVIYKNYILRTTSFSRYIYTLYIMLAITHAIHFYIVWSQWRRIKEQAKLITFLNW